MARHHKRINTHIPVAHTAAELGVDVLPLDAFPKDLVLPENCLIVAASYGKFIPKRILKQSPYRGLNVHPSLLPQLRGSSPIQRAIMRGWKTTGVSVQTLSTEGFDLGEVLSRKGGVEVGEKGYAELRDELGKIGAELLLDVIRDGRFIHGKDIVPAEERQGELFTAPKLELNDSRVNWEAMTVNEALQVMRALGKVWTRLEMPIKTDLLRKPKVDLEFEKVNEADFPELPSLDDTPPGKWEYLKWSTPEGKREAMLVRAKDGWVNVTKLRLEKKNWVVAPEWARTMKAANKNLEFERTWEMPPARRPENESTVWM